MFGDFKIYVKDIMHKVILKLVYIYKIGIHSRKFYEHNIFSKRMWQLKKVTNSEKHYLNNYKKIFKKWNIAN